MKSIIKILVLLLFQYSAFSQYFSVFDADTSAFPVISAKLFAFDNQWKMIKNLSVSDFSVTENGVNRTILSLKCPPEKPPLSLSSVLVMDVSGSMGDPLYHNLDLAKQAGTAWINAQPDNSPWECAITAFDNSNYMIQDFTGDKTLLTGKLNLLQPNGGTNYDAAFIDSPAGGIRVASTGQYKRVLVFLSDGQPNFDPKTTQIISEAQNNNIEIYTVTLRMPCPDCLKQISTSTGGKWFEYISSENEARNIYLQILQLSRNKDQFCEIEWQSDYDCIRYRTAAVLYKTLNLKDTINYMAPGNSVSQLIISPPEMKFGGVIPPNVKDTTITIAAKYRDIHISAIQFKNPRFSIVNYGGSAPPFTLKQGQNRTLKIRYTAPDSGYVFSWLDVISDVCINQRLSLTAGFKGNLANNSLRLVSPNGGEEFIVGTDTVFTWEGVLPSDEVKLEYSTDSGSTWKLITKNATGLRYVWNGVPNTPSRRCLGRVSLVTSVDVCTCDMEGIVACWPFNGNANDESGHGHNGTINGNVTLTAGRFGKANSAYNFRGGNIVANNNGLHNPLFSVTCWIKPDTARSFYPSPIILSDYDGYYHGWALFMDKGNNKVATTIAKSSTIYSQCYSNFSVPLNNWAFIAVTYDSTVIKLYFNGNLINSIVGSNYAYSTLSTMIMGGYPWDGDQSHYEGIIDDIKLFNRVITDDEIECLYNASE